MKTLVLTAAASLSFAGLALFPAALRAQAEHNEPAERGKGAPQSENKAAPFDPKKAVDAGLGMPSPYDKFLALDQVLGKKKIDWKAAFSKTAVDIAVDDITDKQVVLPVLLGVRISDGVMAIKARDAELLNRCASEIEAAAKKLGVAEGDLARAKAVRSTANAGEWLKVFMELGFLQQDIMKTLDREENKAQGSLVIIGGWVQGARYVSAVIKDNYTPETSNFLREPLLVKELVKKLDALPAGTKGSPLVVKMGASLREMGEIINIKVDGSITPDKVERVRALATEIVSSALGSVKS